MRKIKLRHYFSAALLLLVLAVSFIRCGGGIKESVTGLPQLQTGAGALKITWTQPTTYTDGSPLTVKGYRIYYGTSTRQYISYIDVGNVTEVTIPNLSLPSTQTYYISVTVYDDAGNESDYSNEALITT